MPAITIADLNNAKTDCEHIAAIATSPALTATDRLGNIKKTLAGAIASIADVVNRGAWSAGTPYGVMDVALSGGTWYRCVVPHTASSSFASDQATKWRVWQGATLLDIADLLSDLASTASATKGAGMVGYSTLRAYVQGTVGDKLQEMVSVRDFGAKGDGITDDTAAIQAAIDYLAASGTGGGVLYFPAGRYRTTSTIYVKNGVRLVGTGCGGFPYHGAASQHSIILADFGTNVNQWVIDSDTRLISGGARVAYNAFVGAGLGSEFSGLYQVGIDGLHVVAVDQTTNIIWGGIRLVGCPDAEVRNCTVLGTGIPFLANTCFASRWLGLHSETHYYGFVAHESNNGIQIDGYFNKIVEPSSLSIPTDRILSIIPDNATLTSYGLATAHRTSSKGLIISAALGSSSQTAEVSVVAEYWTDVCFLLRSESTVFSKLYCESTRVDYVVTGAYCSAVGEALSAFAANAKGFDIGFDCRLDMTVQGLFAVNAVLGAVNDDANVANRAALILRGITSYGQTQNGRVTWEGDARPLAYISFDGASLAVKNAYNMVAVSRVPGGAASGDYYVDFRRPSNGTALQGEVVANVTLATAGFGYVQLGGGDGIQNNRIRVTCINDAGVAINPARVMVTIFG